MDDSREDKLNLKLFRSNSTIEENKLSRNKKN